MNKQTMYKLTYGLFVLTAHENGKDNGCIINTAGQVTSVPTRISVAVNKSNYTHDMILRTGVFNISIISEDADFELFKHFGFQTGRDTDKFKDFKDAKIAANGVLYVTKGTNAWISASVVRSVDLGTHTLFIANVTDMDILSDAPSVTYTYYQDHIKPKPQEPSKPAGKPAWRCKICGYIYEGETLPDGFECPLCKHPAEDFEKIYL